MTNNFVTDAIDQLISQTTQYLDSRLSDLLHSEQKLKLLEVEEGHVPQCAIAGDATGTSPIYDMFVSWAAVIMVIYNSFYAEW